MTQVDAANDAGSQHQGAGSAPAPALGRRPHAFSPFRFTLDLFSNVWFGIVLMALLFLYCSIGSAVPAVRQHPLLEMTEFEWFHWWPFNVLIALVGLALITVTLRRIPFRLVNAGVWTIHTGIIVLVIGSYYYFTTKIEGDTPVFRRQVSISLPGMDAPETLPVLTGSRLAVVEGTDTWVFEIQSTNTQWTIVSDPHKGEKAYAVNVLVRPPVGEPFIRQLLAGYPQFTEDVIPGEGRAIKVLGRKLVADELKLSLDYLPQRYFHVMDTWALFVRKLGEKSWIQWPIDGLPRYHDRIASRDQVWTDPSSQPGIRSIDLAVSPPADADVFGDASVRVTGYLRYALMQSRWRGGGERLNPVIQLSVVQAQADDQQFELVAFDPSRNSLEGRTVQFLWFDDPAMIDGLPTDSRALLHVEVPAKSVSFDLPLTPDVVVGRDGPWQVIEGTEFSYRVANVVDDLAMPGGQRPVSIAMVEVKSPDGQFTRMVADRPESTRDIRDDGDPHGGSAGTAGPVDPRIHMTYAPRSAPVIIAASPRGLHCVVNGESGRNLSKTIELGEAVEVVPGLSVRVDSFWLRAITATKPFVVPPSRRDRGAREANSMIRLEVDTGQGVQAKWLGFNQYALPSAEYAYQGRLAYRPQRFRLPGGEVAEVLFSRQRLELPSPIAMEDFQLDTHVGGYTGSSLTIRNYVSRLRFSEPGGWTEPTAIAVNHPTEHGGFWYFQSTWDRPPRGSFGAGMNYTGLGVGNRHGVGVQLAGCCLAVTGMAFAFYVKPIIRRRRAEGSRKRTERTADQTAVIHAPPTSPEPANV